MCERPENSFNYVVLKTDEVIAGECKICNRLMVETLDHEARGFYPQAVFDAAFKLAPGRPMLYNARDLPNLHADHEYLHIQGAG